VKAPASAELSELAHRIARRSAPPDILKGSDCCRAMHIIARIQDPVVTKPILAHLAGKARPAQKPRLPPGRGSAGQMVVRGGNAALTSVAAQTSTRYG
jgi:hypothetical protein